MLYAEGWFTIMRNARCRQRPGSYSAPHPDSAVDVGQGSCTMGDIRGHHGPRANRTRPMRRYCCGVEDAPSRLRRLCFRTNGSPWRASMAGHSDCRPDRPCQYRAGMFKHRHSREPEIARNRGTLPPFMYVSHAGLGVGRAPLIVKRDADARIAYRLHRSSRSSCRK